jgi:hypothetical protein
MEDPTSRWGLIFHGSGQYTPTHTRDDWWRIVDAIRFADLAHQRRTAAHIGRPAVRGDSAWCRIAADRWTESSASGDPSRLRTDPVGCLVEEPVVRAWLDAPWVPPGDRPQTVAQVEGWVEAFDPRHVPDPAAIADLVDQAQHVGVFGIRAHRIALWHRPGNGSEPTFVVTVAPPDGPGWASPPLARDRLVHTGQPSVDSIVGLFYEVAGIANRLLANGGRARDVTSVHHEHADTPALPAHIDGWPVGNPMRAFPPLRQVHAQPSIHGSGPVGPNRDVAADRRPSRGARHG